MLAIGSPLLVPSVAPDDYSEGAFCIKLSFDWYYLLQGFSQFLEQRNLWEDMTDNQYETLLDWLRIWYAMDCECGIDSVRVSPDGKLQVRRNGVWTDAEGDGGDTTVVNNNQTLIEEYYDTFERPEGVEDSAIACSIAEGLSSWLADQFNAGLDEIEVASNEFVALTTITAIFPPLYLIIQPIATMIDNISELGVSIVRALFDANAEEGMLCAIYCYLKINGGIVTKDNIGELKNDIINSMPPGLVGIWDSFLSGIENNALVARASLYHGGSDLDCGLLCVDCGGCSLYRVFKPQWECTIGIPLADVGCFDTDVVTNGSGGEVELWLTLPELVLFTKLTFRTNNQATGGTPKTSIFQVYNNETLVGTFFTVTSEAPASDCELNIFDDINLVGNRVRIYEISPTTTIFSDITQCWEPI